MKRKAPRPKESIKDLQADPEFMKEIDKFIKASLRVHKY